MATYAIVYQNAVINVCVWDGNTPFDPGEGCKLILLSTLPPGADIGWTEQNGVWAAPLPA